MKSFKEEERKDPALVEILHLLEEGVPTEDEVLACGRKLALQEDLYTSVNHTRYHLDSKQGHQKQVVVPRHLWKETHYGPISATSQVRDFSALCRDTGGGQACLLMPNSSCAAALSVFSCLVGEVLHPLLQVSRPLLE